MAVYFAVWAFGTVCGSLGLALVQDFLRQRRRELGIDRSTDSAGC